MKDIRRFFQTKETKRSMALYLVNFLAIFFSYALLLQQHLSTDAYSIIMDPYDPTAALCAGRVVWLPILKLMELLHIHPIYDQAVNVFIFMLCLALCATHITILFADNRPTPQMLFLNLCVMIGFVNFYLQEWFLFAESTPYYAIGITAATEGAICSIKKQRVITIMLAMIAVLSYQSMLAVFLIYGLFFIWMKRPKQWLREIVWLLAVTIGCGATSIAVQKITVSLPGIESSRGSVLSLSVIIEKIPVVWAYIVSVFCDAQNVFPPLILPVAYLVPLVILVVKAIVKQDRKNTAINLAAFCLMMLASVGITFGPQLLTDTVWMAPRVIVPAFSLLSMLLATAFLEVDGRWRHLIVAISIMMLCMNVYYIQVISADTLKTNALERNTCLTVEAYIEQYEQETGNTVDQIAYYQDANTSWKEESVKYSWYDTNIRIQMVGWARIQMMNANTGRTYRAIDSSPEIYGEYFNEKDWNVLMPDQQLVFKDNTLHWCIY